MDDDIKAVSERLARCLDRKIIPELLTKNFIPLGGHEMRKAVKAACLGLDDKEIFIVVEPDLNISISKNADNNYGILFVRDEGVYALDEENSVLDAGAGDMLQSVAEGLEAGTLKLKRAKQFDEDRVVEAVTVAPEILVLDHSKVKKREENTKDHKENLIEAMDGFMQRYNDDIAPKLKSVGLARLNGKLKKPVGAILSITQKSNIIIEIGVDGTVNIKKNNGSFSFKSDPTTDSGYVFTSGSYGGGYRDSAKKIDLVNAVIDQGLEFKDLDQLNAEAALRRKTILTRQFKELNEAQNQTEREAHLKAKDNIAKKMCEFKSIFNQDFVANLPGRHLHKAGVLSGGVTAAFEGSDHRKVYVKIQPDLEIEIESGRDKVSLIPNGEGAHNLKVKNVSIDTQLSMLSDVYSQLDGEIDLTFKLVAQTVGSDLDGNNTQKSLAQKPRQFATGFEWLESVPE